MLKFSLDKVNEIKYVIHKANLRNPELLEVSYVKTITLKKGIHVVEYKAFDYFTSIDESFSLKINIRDEVNEAFDEHGFFKSISKDRIFIKEEGKALAIYKALLISIDNSFQKEIEKIKRLKESNEIHLKTVREILHRNFPEYGFISYSC